MKMISAKEKIFAKIEELLETGYRIIDILPEQVPAERSRSYALFESFFRRPEQMEKIRCSYLSLLLKLCCYADLLVCFDEEIIEDPEPEQLDRLLKACKFSKEKRYNYLLFLFPAHDVLIQMERDDTYLTVYGNDGRIGALIDKMAAQEGFYTFTPER